MTVTHLNLFIDHMCRVYGLALGGSSYGIGEPGDSDKAADAAADLVAAILATADSDIITQLHTKANNQKNALSAVRIGTWRDVLNGVETLARAEGYSSLDDMMLKNNDGTDGTNTCLQSQYWRNMYYRWKNAYPTPKNLYFEELQGAIFGGVTFTNALRKLVIVASTPTQTAGTDISTNYAGGIPYLNVSGFAGASDTVTVTGTQEVNGTRTATKTWTATVAGNGSVALASGGGNAASANALIVAVSAISAGSNITGATIYAESRKPSGRQAVPL